jgi:histone H1/5
MTEGTTAPVSSVSTATANSPKKATKKPTKGKSTHGSSHPKYSDMIKSALKSLNGRGGSSRAAILKFVLANYSLDPVQANQHLKLALKNGVKAKHFKQTKGNGASGSFKLAEGAAKPAKKKSAKPKKASSGTAASGTKKRPRSKSAGSKPVKKVAAPANTNNSAATTTTTAATPAATTSTTPAAKPKKVKIAKSTTKSASGTKTKKPKQSKKILFEIFLIDYLFFYFS